VIADRRGALCARQPDGNAFRAYVRQVLVPELTPGDAVIMDNLPARKVHGVRQAIDAAGTMVLCLLAYSPDFNPIEMAFSKSPRAFPPSCACWNLKPAPLKALLRAAAARTIPDLREAIRLALNAFTPSECQNYFAAAGYDAI
jgi:transposase